MDFNQCLLEMIACEASDLYITVGKPVSFRIDGNLVAQGEPLTEATLINMLQSTMSKGDWDTFKQSREANFAIVRDEGRFRVSAFFQREMPGAVIRRIETTIPTIDSLKLPKAIGDLSLAKRGLVLVVGATGSGKSTTLAAMVGHRNQHTQGHILTVEDPIEFCS